MGIHLRSRLEVVLGGLACDRHSIGADHLCSLQHVLVHLVSYVLRIVPHCPGSRLQGLLIQLPSPGNCLRSNTAVLSPDTRFCGDDPAPRQMRIGAEQMVCSTLPTTEPSAAACPRSTERGTAHLLIHHLGGSHDLLVCLVCRRLCIVCDLLGGRLQLVVSHILQACTRLAPKLSYSRIPKPRSARKKRRPNCLKDCQLLASMVSGGNPKPSHLDAFRQGFGRLLGLPNAVLFNLLSGGTGVGLDGVGHWHRCLLSSTPGLLLGGLGLWDGLLGLPERVLRCVLPGLDTLLHCLCIGNLSPSDQQTLMMSACSRCRSISNLLDSGSSHSKGVL